MEITESIKEAIQFKFNDGGRNEAGYKGHAGDCATRALSIVVEKPYQEVYDLINELAKKERITKRKTEISNARTGVYPQTLKKAAFHYGLK